MILQLIKNIYKPLSAENEFGKNKVYGINKF